MNNTVSIIICMVLLLVFAIISLVWLFKHQKANRYFDRKGIWWYILAAFLSFSLMGFLALTNLEEIQRLYFIVQTLVLLLGTGHVFLLFSFFRWPETTSYLPEFLATILINFVGALCFIGIFWLVDAQMNKKYEADVLMIAQSFMCFSIPYLMYRTYTLLTQVPDRIYHAWKYPNRPRPSLQRFMTEDNCIQVTFRMSSDLSRRRDLDIFKRSRFPMNVRFGDIFHRFVELYNEKNPDAEIKDLKKNAQGHPIGWLFWHQALDRRGKSLIDPDNISIPDLREGDLIYAERVLLDPTVKEFEEAPIGPPPRKEPDELDLFGDQDELDLSDDGISITER